MGCSKPLWEPCPKASITDPDPMCFGCRYHTFETGDTQVKYSYVPSIAKHIHEFTTDELLAEIRRRCGT